MSSVLVTFRVESEQREKLTKALGKASRIVFLSDVSPQDRATELAHADVLISWSVAEELRPEEFKLLDHAKMLQLLSAGVDHLPFRDLPLGLMIASNAGAYADPMAEHAVAMILAINKNLLDRQVKLRNGTFDQTKVNRMLHGSTCAVLGFGGIGKAVTRLLQCFDVKIYALNTTGRTNEPVEFIGTLKDLEHVLRLADIVILALPLTNSTRKLIGREQLGWMKNDAILVNVARADIIDEAALYQKLKENPQFTAAIDAWWIEPIRHGKFSTNYPFLELPNVLGSPHNSGVVHSSFHKGTMHAIENVKRFLNHERVLGVVRRSDYT
jgi:phosphoglycerate dehydrogenase-like enzyme